MAYLLLFFSALGAATLLPFSSEATLLLLLNNHYAPWLLWGVATLGNTLGSMINALLGRYFLRYKHTRWFPVAPQKLERSTQWFARFGVWSLLFAWLPVVGDALTLAAGVLRVRWWLFIILVAIGKGGRYAMVVVLWLQIEGVPV